MVAYGYPLFSSRDPYVLLVEQVSRLTFKYATPVVDFIPACKVE